MIYVLSEEGVQRVSVELRSLIDEICRTGELKNNRIGMSITHRQPLILAPIRSLFGKANHVSAQLFSYNGKGACPHCKGKGVVITEMAFMDPVVQVCEQCEGKRYSQPLDSKKMRGCCKRVLSTANRSPHKRRPKG